MTTKSQMNKINNNYKSDFIFSIVSIVLAIFAITSGSLLLPSNISAAKLKSVSQTVQMDFDGDGKSDTAIFRNGDWFVNQSVDGFMAQTFGLTTDTPVPADFDGDQKTDMAIWRPTDVEGEPDFFVLRSLDNTLTGVAWGKIGDIPVCDDFDGDNLVDYAVYRPGIDGDFFILHQANIASSPLVKHFRFGIQGDKPVVADYSGDGRADFAVFRPSNSTWYINYSTQEPDDFKYYTFGLSTDKLVPADYDGDGKVDLAVFRESDQTWYVRQSSVGVMRRQKWGLATDKLVPADYDGDSVADIAVYRDGHWYILQSSNNLADNSKKFGNSTDLPLPSLSVR